MVWVARAIVFSMLACYHLQIYIKTQSKVEPGSFHGQLRDV